MQNEKRDQKVKRIEKHSSTSPDVQFKEFSLTKQKNDLGKTMSAVENHFKKSDKKENQCQNAAKENKKPLARNVNLIRTKNQALNEL